MSQKTKIPASPLPHRASFGLISILLIFVMLFVSVACELGATMNWAKTLTYRTNTPELTSTHIAQLTATVMVGKVNQQIGKKQIQVILDPLTERDVFGISVQVMQIGEYLVVDTVDILKRYLPDAEIVPMDREPSQQIVAHQVNAAWGWGVKTGTSLDVAPILGPALGAVQLGNIHSFLAANWKQGGINLVIPVLKAYKEEQSFSLFRTAAPHTVVMVPSEMLASSGGAKLAAPAGEVLFSPYAIFSFATVPASPLSTYIKTAQSVTVGNYIGASGTDIIWAEFKSKEVFDGFPAGYKPSGVSQEIVNWLEFDKPFLTSMFYLDTEQTDEVCTKAEQLGKVIRQSPAAGTQLNGLRKKIKLTVCNQVVSQKKYQTLMYVSPTITQTPTPTITFTPRPTITPTVTLTLAPTNTSAPTSTASQIPETLTAQAQTQQAKQTQTANAATLKAATATSVAATLTATHIVPSPTATSEPQILDEFTTSPNGYDTGVWNLVDTPASGVGSRTWPREERLRQEVDGTNYGGPGDLRLVTKEACLWGEAQFKMRSSDSGTGVINVGFLDSTLANGVYIKTYPSDTDNTQLVFSVLSAGTSTAKKVTLNNSTNGSFTIYKIVWEAKGETKIKADLYINSATSPNYSITASKPESRLNFVIRTVVTANPGSSWVEMEYVHIYSDSCQ